MTDRARRPAAAARLLLGGGSVAATLAILAGLTRAATAEQRAVLAQLSAVHPAAQPASPTQPVVPGASTAAATPQPATAAPPPVVYVLPDGTVVDEATARALMHEAARRPAAAPRTTTRGS